MGIRVNEYMCKFALSSSFMLSPRFVLTHLFGPFLFPFTRIPLYSSTYSPFNTFTYLRVYNNPLTVTTSNVITVMIVSLPKDPRSSPMRTS